MPARRFQRIRRPRTTAAAAVFVLLLAGPAAAIKWNHCPSQAGAYPSALGAVSAPFIHPGHDLGIFLSANEVNATGGFRLDVESRVTVTFVSLFGDAITLEPVPATVLNPSTMFFTFPDTQQTLGRPLAGPVDLLVTSGETTTAHIVPRHLVALPPSIDVGAATAGGPANAYATIDGNGDFWLPVSFSAYGPMQKPMPMCPGVFIPITAVNVGLTVRTAPTSVGGVYPTYPYLRSLKKVELYLGDFVVNGFNAYGARVGRLPVFRISRGWGIRVCGLNDAAEFVIKARGWRRWAKPWSPFAPLMANSAPLAIDFRDFTADPTVSVRPGGLDAFGQECVLE